MSSHEIDTIVLGVPCTIKFDYQPYEPADTGPEAMYPGCEEGIDITDVLVGGVSVWEWFDTDQYDWFHEVVQEHLIRQHELEEEYRQFTRYEKEMMYNY